MLNKENQKKAEEIAEQLKPLFYRAYELGRIFDHTRERQEKARQVAKCWQWRNPYDCERVGLNCEELESIRQNDPQKWHDELYHAYANETKEETRHTCARINFINYLNYFSRFAADLIRPYWGEFVKRQGLTTLGEIINKLNPKKGDFSAGDCSIYFYLRDETPQEWIGIEILICTGWACGCSGSCLKYYQNNPAEVWHAAELPPLVTPQQYERAKQKIKKYIHQADKIREECQEYARKCGLLGFVEIIGDIIKTK